MRGPARGGGWVGGVEIYVNLNVKSFVKSMGTCVYRNEELMLGTAKALKVLKGSCTHRNVWSRYSFDPALATSQEGGQGSLYYEGRFYDNVLSRRRGVTALTWPKPKIKFDFKGKVCVKRRVNDGTQNKKELGRRSKIILSMA